MSKISIHSAISGALSVYVHHLVLLLTAGALVGFVGWAAMVGPRMVAQHMGVYQDMPVEEESMTEMSPDGTVTRVVNRISMKISNYMDTTSKGALLVVFLVMVALWLANMFAHLGLMKLALQLVDKNKGSFETFFSVKQYLLSYISGLLLFGLYALVIMVGSAVVIAPIVVVLVKLAHLSPWIIMLAVPLVMVGVWGYLIRYILFSYCIIDKNTGARDSLRMSAKITAGERVHLFMFLLVMAVVFGVLFSLIKVTFGFECTGVNMHSLAYMLFISMTVTPLATLMFSKIYRQLGGK